MFNAVHLASRVILEVQQNHKLYHTVAILWNIDINNEMNQLQKCAIIFVLCQLCLIYIAVGKNFQVVKDKINTH